MKTKHRRWSDDPRHCIFCAKQTAHDVVVTLERPHWWQGRRGDEDRGYSVCRGCGGSTPIEVLLTR
jgi:hypothetical protein